MILKNKKILITCGPTWVAIDDVRVISNTSTGALGQLIAQKLNREGAAVTLLEGPVTHPLKDSRVQIKKFLYYEDLSKLIRCELKKNYAIVIHLAAVSDYKLKKTLKGKLSSHLKKLTLELIPTKKIINDIKRIAPKTFLVGFKLLPKISKSIAQKAAGNLRNSAKCDLVVVNSVTNGKYTALVVTETNCSSLITLKNNLVDLLIKSLNKS